MYIEKKKKFCQKFSVEKWYEPSQEKILFFHDHIGLLGSKAMAH